MCVTTSAGNSPSWRVRRSSRTASKLGTVSWPSWLLMASGSRPEPSPRWTNAIRSRTIVDKVQLTYPCFGNEYTEENLGSLAQTNSDK
jgi:hypothetical protein